MTYKTNYKKSTVNRVDPDEICEWNNTTALLLSSQYGNLKISKYLISRYILNVRIVFKLLMFWSTATTFIIY